MRSLTKEDSQRIDSLRFMLSVLVIFIHSGIGAEDAARYGVAFAEPAAVTWLKLLIQDVLGGAAVPLFFLFSGYLQFCKQDAYPVLLKKRARSLLVPYVLWTLLCVLFFFAAQSVPPLATFFTQPGNIVRSWTPADWLRLFWAHDGIYPLVYQFWFVRDLMVLTACSPLLDWCARRAPFAVAVAAALCYLDGLPLGFGTALFFYLAGRYCAAYGASFFKAADRVRWGEYALLLALALAARAAFPEALPLHGLGTAAACLFMLKLSGAIVSHGRTARAAARLSGYSFFVYAIHAPFLVNSLNKIAVRLIPQRGAGCLLGFLLPALLTAALAPALGAALRRLLPPVWNALTGSRGGPKAGSGAPGAPS